MAKRIGDTVNKLRKVQNLPIGSVVVDGFGLPLMRGTNALWDEEGVKYDFDDTTFYPPFLILFLGSLGDL